MSSPISICYIELILEPVKKRICGSATFRFPPSEPLLLKENPVVSGILFCDVSIFFVCLEQLMMFQSGFVDLGGMMFPDDILLKSVYDWCNVLRPWIKSAGLKGSKRGGKVPVPAKLGRSMGCYSLEQTRPYGHVAVGQSRVVVRGRRGNMLLVELELKHSNERRPARRICS